MGLIHTQIVLSKPSEMGFGYESLNPLLPNDFYWGTEMFSDLS